MASPAERKKEEGNDAFSRGDMARAVELYSGAIKLDGEQHVFYANRAAALLALQRFEEARADCLKCLELNREFTKAYLRLAHAEKGLGNKDAALKALHDGLEHFSKEDKANPKKAYRSGLDDFKKLEKELKEPVARGPVPNAVEQAVRSAEAPLLREQGLQELGKRVISAKYKLQDVAGKNIQRVRDHQSRQIILKSLENSLAEAKKKPDEAVTYRRMGKAYVLQDCSKIMSDLKSEMKGLEAEVDNLNKGETMMKRQLEDAERMLQDFLRRQRAQ